MSELSFVELNGPCSPVPSEFEDFRCTENEITENEDCEPGPSKKPKLDVVSKAHEESGLEYVFDQKLSENFLWMTKIWCGDRKESDFLRLKTKVRSSLKRNINPKNVLQLMTRQQIPCMGCDDCHDSDGKYQYNGFEQHSIASSTHPCLNKIVTALR